MALQRTAHDACSRKIHCVRKNYLDDPFVGFFARDETIVNSPLMNRGTWLRTTAIENCVKGFAATAGQPIQVINFGAGMDTLYFRLKKANPDELSSLVQSQYVLQSCNLYDAKGVAEGLKQHLRSGVPTIMLAEMVFVYIEGSVTTELLKIVMADVIGTETNTMLVTYDAIQPFDRFGKVMVENLQQFGAEFKGIADFPTPEAHAQRCRDLGFKTVKALTMKNLYLSVPRNLQIGLNKLEMIDDWEEWNLMHEHYCFVVASTEDAPLPKFF